LLIAPFLTDISGIQAAKKKQKPKESKQKSEYSSFLFLAFNNCNCKTYMYIQCHMHGTRRMISFVSCAMQQCVLG
jgi:hypothetical protein